MGTQQKVDLATQIFDEHGASIRAMIRRHVNKREDEEDIFQNLYLSLVCNPIPSPLTNTLAYLNTVIKNDVIDAARRRKSYQDMVSRYAVSQTQEEIDSSPENEVIREEEAQRIATFVRSSLPAHEARAVIERYGYGRTTADAAKHMQVKERTVSRYLCVGLKRIRKAIVALETEPATHR